MDSREVEDVMGIIACYLLLICTFKNSEQAGRLCFVSRKVFDHLHVIELREIMIKKARNEGESVLK